MEDSNIHLSDLCLVCLGANRITESIEERLAGRKISDMLKTLLPKIVVADGDDMPLRICMLCKNNLILAFDFQKMLLQSDAQIKEILASKIQSTEVKTPVKVENEEYVYESVPIYEDEIGVEEFPKIEIQQPEPEIQSVRHECSICHKVFSRPSHLKRHNIVHTRVKKPKIKEKRTKTFKCEICQSSFTTFYGLQVHSNQHVNGYLCKFCQKEFTIKAEMRQHVAEAHKDQQKYICEHCEKSFTNKSSLNGHIRTHFPDDKPFLCPVCGQAFHLSSSLRHHVMIHSGEKKFSCTYCPLKFLTNSGLKSHLRSHTGEKSHFCPTCNKGFSKSYSLKKHIRTHTGERPYACDTCDAKFNSSNHLKRHVRTHTGEKPYQCTYCPKAYAQSSDLVKHLRVHVGTNTYKCDLCSMSFRLFGELKTHKNEHFQQNK